jgi:hypothetical protein
MEKYEEKAEFKSKQLAANNALTDRLSKTVLEHRPVFRDQRIVY